MTVVDTIQCVDRDCEDKADDNENYSHFIGSVANPSLLTANPPFPLVTPLGDSQEGRG